jgi:hypothetical protein
LFALACVCTATLGAQDSKEAAHSRAGRIVNETYGFSVVRPPKWFVYDGGEVPSFFNFRPEKSIQGELPQGGASIVMVVAPAENERQVENALVLWAERRVRTHNGTDPKRSAVAGPAATGPSPAIRVAFSSIPISADLPSLGYVMAFWRYHGQLFGLELSYRKDDPNQAHYESVMMQVMRSFTPLQ